MKNCSFLSVWLILIAILLSSCCKEPGYETDLACRIQRVLEEYKNEAHNLERERASFSDEGLASQNVVESSAHWWDTEITDSLQEGIPVHPKTLDSLLVSALSNSTQIKVFSDIPLIRSTGIQVAESTFDTRAFLNAEFERINRPVSSELEITSTSRDELGDRLKETEYTIEGGLRKKLYTGADVELKQLIGRKTSNSDNFIPSRQGKAELTLRVTQPLLKGRGIAYNTTAIKIAHIDCEIAQQEFLRQTEAHLLEVARAYWSLYQARALYYQKRRLVERTEEVLEELESRTDLDANASRVTRAKASYAQRKADVVRAEIAIRNSQDRLKTLVSDPALSIYSEQEIIPVDAPFYTGQKTDILDAAAKALKMRSEVLQGFKQLHAALLREKVSKNELMPTLNMFLEAKLNGLTGSREYYSNSWNNQFSKGKPGYAGGLNFEFPLCNNAAEANLIRSRIEIRQQVNQITTTIETILLEIKVAVREVDTSLKDVLAKYESMLAAREDLSSIMDRRSIDVGTEFETTSYLEFLLESQERLAKAEEQFVASLVIHNLAMLNLERAQGTLISYNDIDPCCQDRSICVPDEVTLPNLQVNKLAVRKK